MSLVKKFYNTFPFPGFYTLNDLNEYNEPIENRYLQIINTQIGNNSLVLDAGCGTGLITNLFALRKKTCHFTGIDFSNSIKFAKKFAISNKIKNVTFINEDLTTYNIEKKFDIIICQGVLHHIPNYKIVLDKLLNSVLPGGKLLLGLYHPYGKIFKNFVKINYKSDVLYMDQEHNPYEISFSYNQVKNLTYGWKITYAGPHILNNVSIPAFFNYKNGGLVLYVLEKDK